MLSQTISNDLSPSNGFTLFSSNYLKLCKFINSLHVGNCLLVLDSALGCAMLHALNKQMCDVVDIYVFYRNIIEFV